MAATTSTLFPELTKELQVQIWKFATLDFQPPFIPNAFRYETRCTVVKFLRRVTEPKETTQPYLDEEMFHELSVNRKNLMKTCRMDRLVALETWKWELMNLRCWTTVPSILLLRRSIKLSGKDVVRTLAYVDGLIE